MTTVPPPGDFPPANGPYWERPPGQTPANPWVAAPGPAWPPPPMAQVPHPVAPQPQIWVNGQWITPPPPGAVPPAQLLSQVRSIGTAVAILLGLTCLATAAMLIADISWLTFLQDASDGYFLAVTEAEIDQAAAFVENTTIVWLAAYLATGIVFIIWFYRIRKNAGVWAPHRQRRGQGWSIGGWLCPIVNFWFPYQIAADALESARPTGSDDRSGRAVIGWWWGFWVASLVIALAVRGISGDLDTVGAVITLAQFDIAYDIAYLAAGLVAILAVRTISATQSRRISESFR